jgi:predicted ATPase
VPTLSAADAASLFTERARRIVPSFQPNDEVVEIARRLDGLPLAVELAAARVKVLTTRQIMERLGRGLDLLTGGGRDVPERQRTLRATIEWSYELMSDGERDLFARLGVFPGSFELGAAEDVVGASLDDLAALIDKSLVRSTEAGRYFMLETIRSFAVERFEAAGAVEALRRAHAAHYAHLVEELEPGLRDARQLGVIDRLAAEQPNTRAALDTLHEARDPRVEAALAANCSYFWFLTGQLREGLSRLRIAYDRVQGHDGRELGRAANGLALLSFITGDVEAARAFSRTSSARQSHTRRRARSRKSRSSWRARPANAGISRWASATPGW